MQNNSICQHSSAFTENSRFKILFKHSTIPCSIVPLSTILVVLEMGPLTSQNNANITLPADDTLWISSSWALTCVSNACFDVCLQVHSVAPMFHLLWQSTAGKPLLHDIAAKIACTFPLIVICAHLYAALEPCFLTEHHAMKAYWGVEE
jgi:hypothetical protein